MVRRLRAPGATVMGTVAVLTTLAFGAGTSSAPVAGPDEQVVVHVEPGVTTASSAAGSPVSTAQCEAMFRIACYGVPQLQTAYDEAPLLRRGLTGEGQTIAIIDAFGSPTIGADLAQFDAGYGLPGPPRLTIVQPVGRGPRWNPTNKAMLAWASETSLDVEWAHAMAPGASILLVETPVAQTEGLTGLTQINRAANYVITNHLATVISESFNATESTFGSARALTAVRSAVTNAAQRGVTIVASAGDNGASDPITASGSILATKAVVAWPASDPLVTAVGGTSLHLDAAGRRTAPDTLWNDGNNSHLDQLFFGNSGPDALAGGGGLSVLFGRPSYQNPVAGVVGFLRGVPDISMSAGCDGAVNIFESFPGISPGWYVTCGTSESVPLFAGIVAIADQYAGHGLGSINPALYSMQSLRATGLIDITSGNNTVSFTQRGQRVTVTGYPARRGYDLVSGVGTVDAARFVPELVAGVFQDKQPWQAATRP